VTVTGFFIWGLESKGSGDAQGVQGQNPDGSLAGEVPQKLQQFADIAYGF